MWKETDCQALAGFLNRDWPWAGFALGDLEPAWMAHCEWWREAGSLVLLYDGLSPRLMCHYGDSSGLATILEAVGDQRVWANIHPDHSEAFQSRYKPASCVTMRRMYCERPVGAIGVAEPLNRSHLPEIEELLRQGEWVLFLPEALESGHYYGVRDEGRLIAMAGTHTSSVGYNIGALGSVFTHPDYRGKGLAAISSSHVLASLGRAGIRRVVLNVREDNEVAQRVYERLGFRTHCVYLDGECAKVGGGAE
ncbi:MAG: GNAT family N-acetyltransferase [Acidobacteria bacterium]|nr:GNAT family N-acetyltransferase [Acidobacteriota bacterium]